jgi:4-hydroxy-4-methyl-2-oxoglutarate aldolase
VIDAGGRPEAAMIGELLSGAARLKGIAGIVVDGPVRDIATLAGWPDFPVLSHGHTARGPSSMDRGTVNAPVTLGDIPVRPGDLVLADDDGIVVLPPEDARAHLQTALAMLKAEERWEEQLATGETTLTVFNIPPAEQA